MSTASEVSPDGQKPKSSLNKAHSDLSWGPLGSTGGHRGPDRAVHFQDRLLVYVCADPLGKLVVNDFGEGRGSSIFKPKAVDPQVEAVCDGGQRRASVGSYIYRALCRWCKI